MRVRAQPATGLSQSWEYNFVFDASANDQTLNRLTVVDEHTREALAIAVSGRTPSIHVIEV